MLPTIEQVTRYMFLSAINRNNGDRYATATELGVCIRTVRNWCRKYGIKKGDNIRPPQGSGYLDAIIVREMKLALDSTDGHRGAAAEILGITSHTLISRLKNNPESRRWFSKKPQKGKFFCATCRQKTSERLWAKNFVLEKKITDDGAYIIRKGIGGAIYVCYKVDSKRSVRTEAHAVGLDTHRRMNRKPEEIVKPQPSASPFVTKKQAEEIKKKIGMY
jgi:hypothetical protein